MNWLTHRKYVFHIKFLSLFHAISIQRESSSSLIWGYVFCLFSFHILSLTSKPRGATAEWSTSHKPICRFLSDLLLPQRCKRLQVMLCNLNQWESLRFSENSLNFSQYTVYFIKVAILTFWFNLSLSNRVKRQRNEARDIQPNLTYHNQAPCRLPRLVKVTVWRPFN